ncbi:hypothetical protein ABT133_35195 [Streptomyces sp. NPDC001835]|uniref:hypothetical protein n=1 Tax=Streptomyces sp. NPDC001835 TaxID=3154528 RepID=UPI003331521F
MASTVGTLGAGALVDRLGARGVINTGLVVLVVDFLLLPWSSANLGTYIAALVVWCVCGWGLLTPQTHRLIGPLPAVAPCSPA